MPDWKIAMVCPSSTISIVVPSRTSAKCSRRCSANSSTVTDFVMATASSLGGAAMSNRLLHRLFRLVQILDARLLDEQVRGAFAVHLQARFVVPLDPAVDRLAVGHHDHHWRLGVHLLQVIEILRVRRLGWGGAVAAAVAVARLAGGTFEV